jgi:hypothetical protein
MPRIPEPPRLIGYVIAGAILGGWFQGLTEWRLAWGELPGALAGLATYFWDRHDRLTPAAAPSAEQESGASRPDGD